MHMLCTFYVLYIALKGSGLVLVSCVLCAKEGIDIAMVEQHGVAVSGPRVKAPCTGAVQCTDVYFLTHSLLKACFVSNCDEACKGGVS